MLRLQDYKIFVESHSFFIGIEQCFCSSLNISFNANPLLISNANHKTLKFYWRNRPQISIIVAIKDQTLQIYSSYKRTIKCEIMFLWACAIVMVASCTIYHMQFLIIVYPTLSCCAQTAFSHCPWWITMKEMDNKPILTITIIMTEDRFHRNFTDYHIFQLLLTTLANQSYFFWRWQHFIM